MNEPTPLHVILVSFNTRDLLRRCLQSLEGDLGLVHVVTVVDNGSADGSVEVLRAEFPWVDVDANVEDLGFAGLDDPCASRARCEEFSDLDRQSRSCPGRRHCSSCRVRCPPDGDLDLRADERRLHRHIHREHGVRSRGDKRVEIFGASWRSRRESLHMRARERCGVASLLRTASQSRKKRPSELGPPPRYPSRCSGLPWPSAGFKVTSVSLLATISDTI